MNTRILRKCVRSPIPSMFFDRRVEGMGQLQPVLFSVEGDRGITLRIEGMADRYGEPRRCWWVLPLASHKDQAKAAFAELEQCHARGIDSPARAWWREYERARAERVNAAPPAYSRSVNRQSDMFSMLEPA